MAVTNTLAYYDTPKNTAVKSYYKAFYGRNLRIYEFS